MQHVNRVTNDVVRSECVLLTYYKDDNMNKHKKENELRC